METVFILRLNCNLFRQKSIRLFLCSLRISIPWLRLSHRCGPTLKAFWAKSDGQLVTESEVVTCVSHHWIDPTMTDEALTALVPVFVFFAFLLTALLMWCLISSCLGISIRRSISNLWEYTLLGMNQSNRMGTRGRFGRQEELWEMEYRGRDI